MGPLGAPATALLGWAVAAGLFTAVAVLIAGPASPQRWLARVRGVPPEEPGEHHGHGTRWWPPLALALIALCGGADGTRGAVLAVCGELIVLTASALIGRQRRRVRAHRRREEVVRAGEVLAGLLRIGQIPATAVTVAARESGALTEAAAVQEVGGDPAAALRRGASLPGNEGLAALARAWEVSLETGSSMCDSIDAASDRLAADHDTELTIDAELSAPRASGRLMGVLPVVGLGLSYGFGGNPVAFLTGSVVGQVCLLGGVALACLGLWWTDAIAAGGRGAGR